MKLFIREKGKFGYLTSAISQPKPKDSYYETWEAENSMIMSWLINSMEPEIGKTYNWRIMGNYKEDLFGPW